MSVKNINISVVYRSLWQDGFAARGWKLAVAINDPLVIASTPYTGNRIPTSVLVHDILDHYLCGLPLSGHRNEAIALTQLGSRTDTDIGMDFQQMIDEDILSGQVNGETLDSFLPDQLRSLLPAGSYMPDKEKMLYLIDKLGNKQLNQALLARFFELGKQGTLQCRNHWQVLGLDFQKRRQFGAALQGLHQQADDYVQAEGYEHADCLVSIRNSRCSLTLPRPSSSTGHQMHISI